MSELSKQALGVENQTNFPNNNTGYITPSLLREFNTDMIDSTVNQTQYDTDSGSWNSSISALNTFTASQQPSFNALNAFTASQLTINSGVNSFTQSANGSITALNAYTASYTSSIATYDEGVLLTANTNALNFTGNGITSSYVSGKVVVDVDFTKLNSATASLNTSASLALVTASFDTGTRNLTFTKGDTTQFSVNIPDVSGSAGGDFVTTSSFNAYTSSNDTKWSTLGEQSGSWITESETGSFAILGANQIFTGNNTFTGNTVVSQSATFGSASFYGPVTINKGIVGDVDVTGSLVATKVGAYDFDSIYYGSQLGGTTAQGTYFGYGSTDYTQTIGAYAGGFDNELQTYVDSTGIYLKDFNGGGYATFLKLLPNSGTNPKPIMTRGLEITGSTNIQSLTASAAQIAGLNYPTTDNGAESFLQTDGAGNLSLQYVKTLYQNIRNRETSSILLGTPLFVSGATGDNADVYIAEASNPLRRPATLIAGDSTLAANAVGKGIVSGHIEGPDTNAYAPGTVIYLGGAGGWTATRPTGSATEVQILGVVTKQGNNGEGLVMNQLGTELPNIQQGYIWVGNGNDTPTAISTGSFITESETGSFARLDANQIFTGNNTITGNTVVSQSATFGTASFYAPVNIPGGITGDVDVTGSLVATKVGAYDFDSLYYGSQLGGTTTNGTFFGYGSNSYEFVVGAYSGPNDNELKITTDTTGIQFGDFNGSGYNTFLKLLPNAGSNPSPIFTRGVELTGSLNHSGSLRHTGESYISGNVWVSGSVNLLNEGGNGHAFSGKALFLTNSVQTGISVESPIHFYQVSKGNFYIQNNVAGVGSGSMNMIAANGANLNISASNVLIDSDLYLDDNGGTTRFALNNNIDSEYIGIKTDWNESGNTLNVYGAEETVELVYNGWGTGYDNGYVVNVGSTGTQFQDWNTSYTNQTWLKIPVNNNNNPAPIFTRGLEVTGSVNVSQVMNLKPQNPLPSGNIGDLAVSGSNLFFYNGAWTQII